MTEEDEKKEITPEERIEVYKEMCQDDFDAEIQEAILRAYQELPSTIKDKLDYSTFWLYHIKEHGKRVGRAWDRQAEEERKEEWEKEEELRQKELLKERGLCKRCSESPRSSVDKDFCSECITILKEEAEPIKERIKTELIADKTFQQQVTSEKKASVYAINLYSDEKEKNKFVYPGALGKEVYNVLKLKKEGVL